MKLLGILLLVGLLISACATTATTTNPSTQNSVMNVAQLPASQSSSQMTRADDTQGDAQSDAQVVTVRVSGGNYFFSPSSVAVNKPVQLVFQASQLPGCSRSGMVPEYGQRKLITNTDNTIEFTPTKTGELYVACTMNMYKGTLIVE